MDLDCIMTKQNRDTYKKKVLKNQNIIVVSLLKLIKRFQCSMDK